MAVHPGRGSLCSDGVSHRHSFLTRNSSQTGVPGFRWPSVKAHPLPYVTTCDRGCQNCTKSFFFNVLVALRLCCCKQAFFSGGEWGLLSSCGVQTSCSGFSCCGAQALGSQASAVVAQGLSCSVGCGIFLDQGSNPWQADSYPVHHQGSPGSTKS